MPSPVAHIYYAQAYLERHPVRDSAGFLRGSIFPDIRYVSGMDRSITHRHGVSLSDIEAQSDAWKAGWLFHNWLDEVWGDYYEQYGYDHHDHAFDTRIRALKVMEDDQLHRALKDVDVEALGKQLRAGSEGEEFGLTNEVIIHWNSLVADLIEARDSTEARELLFHAMHISAASLGRLEREEKLLRRDRDWPDRVRDGRRVIEQLF